MDFTIYGELKEGQLQGKELSLGELPPKKVKFTLLTDFHSFYGVIFTQFEMTFYKF